MVILFTGQWPDHSSLVEEVTVDFCPIQSSVGDLHFDELTLVGQSGIKSALIKNIVWGSYDSARFGIGGSFGRTQRS